MGEIFHVILSHYIAGYLLYIEIVCMFHVVKKVPHTLFDAVDNVLIVSHYFFLTSKSVKKNATWFIKMPILFIYATFVESDFLVKTIL